MARRLTNIGKRCLMQRKDKKMDQPSRKSARIGLLESSGVYYRRLLRSLLISSSIFAVISLAIFSIVQIQFSGLEDRSNEVLYNSQSNLLNVSVQYIEQTVASVDTYVLDSWMDDNTEMNWRYYNTSRLYRWLSSSSSRMGGVSYMPVLIGNALGGMVITPTGTCTIDYYFREYANLPKESEEGIREMLRTGSTGVGLFPVYSDEGIIQDLYIAYPYVSGEGNSIMLTRLYLSRFFDIAENQYPYIMRADGTVIPFRLGAESEEIAKAIAAGEEEAYSSYMPNMLLQYVSYFQADNLVLFFIVCWIVLIIGYGTLLYLLVFRQAGKLYRPLFEALSSDSDDLVIDRDTDELALIKERNEMLLQLADRLDKANKEALHYATIRAYRSLLEGASGNGEDDSLEYAVSVIKFRDPGEGSGNLVSFQLILQIKECEWLHYVPFGFDRFAVILRAGDMADARSKLLDIVHSIPEDAEASVVLSSLVRGKNNLHKAYKQCQELLCIIPSRQTQQIIMADDAAAPDDGYSFSADEEAVLINMVTSGNPESLCLFDTIVSRNMDADISGETRLNFCLCLAAMISRLFSDLRTRPVDLIGEDIDYGAFYQDMPADEIIRRIRDILSKTVAAVASSADESDARMLSQMKRFIHENYMRDIGLQDLADAFNISPKYCGMLFSRLSNDTFRNYLNLYRTEESKRMLREDPCIKIQDLARMVGFNSPNSFIRVFSKYTGMTPKAYAERAGE